MKLKKMLLVIPLIALSFLTVACNDNATSSVQNNHFTEYYDTNWTPGDNSLKANQPKIKNPVGEFTKLNELRRSQNRVGLPSKGEANILVVPLSFYGDSQIQSELQNQIDLTISQADIQNINDMYFAENLTMYPSVSTYYKNSSFGKLNLSGVVSPVVTLPNQYSDYLYKIALGSINDVYNEIVDYVYNYLFVETETYYIGDFDSDNDRNIDAISFIINYPYNLEYQTEDITSLHQLFTGPNNVCFKKDLKSSIPVNSFSLISDYFRTARGTNDSHIFISLIGEMLGLSNYQDLTLNPTTSLYRAPIGYIDPMSGSTGDHNVFSKYQLGWIEPRFIKAEDISDNGLEIELNSSISSGETIVLYSKDKSMYGEYLMIDLYSPTGVNAYDSNNYSLYGSKQFDKEAIRVYQVDSRLVRGNHQTYLPYNSEPDFSSQYDLPSGEKANYMYDYAYTNNSVNTYQEYGLKNYPLVSLLSKNGSNRHLTDFQTELTIDDMFLTGDSFGNDDQIEGFYKNFAFHGNGYNEDKLNITFTVNSIENGKANIILRRVK